MAPRGRATQQPRDTRKESKTLRKATSFLFPIKMIAKLERTTKHRTITDSRYRLPQLGVTINNKSTTEPPP